MAAFHLIKSNSATIGFVIACLFERAISVDELRDWADFVLTSETDYPDYILDLSSFTGYAKDIYAVLGFVPDREFTDDQRLALLGHAYMRGRDPADPGTSRAEALAALNENPEIHAEFKKTFPFLIGDP